MNKYWPSKRSLRNSVEPFHKVTHRAIGDIPGCTPAPREGTFRPVTREEAAAETLARADVYASYISKYIRGEYTGDNSLRDMYSDISRIKPMTGAFGEKL